MADSDNFKELYLIDFGGSVPVNSITRVRTPVFLAPEIISKGAK